MNEMKLNVKYLLHYFWVMIFSDITVTMFSQRKFVSDTPDGCGLRDVKNSGSKNSYDS